MNELESEGAGEGVGLNDTGRKSLIIVNYFYVKGEYDPVIGEFSNSGEFKRQTASEIAL